MVRMSSCVSSKTPSSIGWRRRKPPYRGRYSPGRGKLRPRVVFTRSRVQTDLLRIMDLYRRSGRFSAVVVPKVIQLPQNRVDLVLRSKRATLRRSGKYPSLETRNTKMPICVRWFRQRKRMVPVLLIRRHLRPGQAYLRPGIAAQTLLAEGYADFRVVSAIAELTPDNKAFFVTFTVEEGERYKFGKIDVRTALTKVDVKKLRADLSINSGDWYNADDVETAIGLLTDTVGSLGYAFLDIRPRVRRDRDKRTIDVTFTIQEGPRVFVELEHIRQCPYG